MLRIILAAAMLFSLTLPAYADFEPQSWQYYKQVSPAKDGFALIDLDQELLEKSQDSLADVRLLDGVGQEVPFQVLQQEPHKEDTLSAQLIDKVIRADHFSSITLDFQNTNQLHNHILLDLENKVDYLRDVKVEGSNDNQTWNLVTTGKVFYVAPNLMQNHLAYTPASFRYIRVSIDARGKDPLVVRGAQVKYLATRDQSPGLALPATLTTTDQQNNKTELFLDLGTKGYLISHVDIEVDGVNFNRSIQYYDSNDGSNWHMLGSDRIFQYKWLDYEAMKTRLTINRTGGRYFKLVIENQDSPPLQVKNVAVWGDSPKILADLRTGSYKLLYGNPDSKLPQYDLTQFSHLIDKNKLAVVKPGPESINTNYRQKLTDNRWLLNTITIMAALVVGLIILKNMKRKA